MAIRPWPGSRIALKVYPLGQRDPAGLHRRQLPPAWGPTPCRRKTARRSTRLNEIIQYEPTELFDPELLGRLATLGIEKGKPFKPDDADARHLSIQAAKQGVAMSRAIRLRLAGAERSSTGRTGAGKRCSSATRSFVYNGHSDIDARTLWHYQAIVRLAEPAVNDHRGRGDGLPDGVQGQRLGPISWATRTIACACRPTRR